MKNRLYDILFIVNIIGFIGLIINQLFIFNFTQYSIILFILLFILYLFSIIRYIKKDKQRKVIDYICISTYYIFIISLFITGVLLQNTYKEMFVLNYINIYAYITHIIFTIYNLI